MMTRKYYVDWSDDQFPAIRVWNFGDWRYGPESLSLTQAKREIIDHFIDLCNFANDRIAEAREVRASDFD